MSSLFNDNENIQCEACGKDIIRKMSLYCDDVEQVLHDIPRTCDKCAFRMLFWYYYGKYKKVKEVIVDDEFHPIVDEHL